MHSSCYDSVGLICLCKLDIIWSDRSDHFCQRGFDPISCFFALIKLPNYHNTIAITDHDPAGQLEYQYQYSNFYNKIDLINSSQYKYQ